MQEIPSVSVIVPCYNTPKRYLDKCIESLVGQTLSNIEIILVDDKSTDDTLSYIKEKANKYPQITVVAHDVNKRQGGARNTGIKLAKAKYIGFVDSDDFVDKTMFEKLYKKIISSTSYDCVRCFMNTYDDNGTSKSLPLLFRKESVLLDGVELTLSNRQHFALCGGGVYCYLVDKQFIIDNDLWFPEHRMYEDNYLWPILKLLVRKVGFVNEDLYYYRQNENSTVHNPKGLDDRIWIEDAKLIELHKRGLFEIYHDIIEFSFYTLGYYNTILCCVHRWNYPFETIKKVYKSQKEKLNLYFPNYKNNPYIRIGIKEKLMNTSIFLYYYIIKVYHKICNIFNKYQ